MDIGHKADLNVSYKQRELRGEAVSLSRIRTTEQSRNTITISKINVRKQAEVTAGILHPKHCISLVEDAAHIHLGFRVLSEFWVC